MATILFFILTFCPWSHELTPKKRLQASVLVSPAPVRVPSQRPLMSCQSRLSINDKGNNVMKPWAVHRPPGIYLTAEENPGKPQLGDRR